MSAVFRAARGGLGGRKLQAVIIGEGYERPALEALQAELGAADWLHLRMVRAAHHPWQRLALLRRHVVGACRLCRPRTTCTARIPTGRHRHRSV